MMATLDYPFTQEEAEAANKSWGCNCGPTALAFALQTSLERVRSLIPDFESKKYTSPTMMAEALANAGAAYSRKAFTIRPEGVERLLGVLFDVQPALVRIQFGGPWTAPGANPRWAYRHTHWIVTWNHIHEGTAVPFVFDCNCGIVNFLKWMDEIRPLLSAAIPRANDLWWPTHIWRLT